MNLTDVFGQTILYACNDWGFGHVARSIPIIEQLMSQNNTIYFAGNKKQNSIVEEYFPKIHFIVLDGYDFRFSGSGKWSYEMASNFFRFKRKISNEFEFINTFCQSNPITLIISDHRYGVRNNDIPSIFITHQVTLPLKGIQKIANYWHTKQLKKFTTIWVLDDEKHTYAGALSVSSIPLPMHYIGIQSRFSSEKKSKEDFVLAVISGPEPYAKQFFKEIVQFASTTNQNVKCICTGKYHILDLPSNLEMLDTVTWKEMDSLFYRCDSIISRSGYTTIMDVKRLDKTAIYIPTPGQLEQIYLAELHR
jgi:uncharacterized protein (TIGR00661 family)